MICAAAQIISRSRTMRIKRLQKLISGPVLVTNPENLQYLTGREFIDESFLLITPKRAVLFGGSLEKVSGIKTDHLRNIGRYVKSGSELHVEGGLRIGERDYIKKHAKGLRLKVEPSAVRKMRLIKDAAELRELQEVYAIGTKVFSQIKKVLPEKPWTEIELARFIKLAGLKLGADDVSFPAIVASGTNSAIPHHKPTTKLIKNGEPIVLDFGFKVNGYCSDFTRTVFVKRAAAKIANMYVATEQAYQAGLKAVESGAIGAAPDAAARKILKRHGFAKYFIHSLGHGTGLAVHEAPGLHPRSTDILENGMVFSIEPGVYIPRVGGIRIEDLVYLKNGTPHYFSQVSTNFKDMVI